jgi:hypothetical protein
MATETMTGSTYTTRPLTDDTWSDFADLVTANNGVWGGCWCMGFHPEGVGKGSTAAGNRDAKRAHVRNGTVHQLLVYDGEADLEGGASSAAAICTPVQRSCSRGSGSSATGGSPSGAG